VKGLGFKRTLAMAALFAVVLTFALEGFPHRHFGGVDDRGCPACQASRQHVSDAPRDGGAVVSPPDPSLPRPCEPAVERIAGPAAVPSASPRSPPPISA
jgi:hypothetical protein